MKHLLLMVLCGCGRLGFEGSQDAATLDSFDKYWQITATGSIVHMNVSPDAVSWTTLGTLDRGADDLTNVGITFGAGRPGGVASGIATFDNLNTCP